MMPVLAYTVQQFPGLTMTFIYREIMALRAHGISVKVFSTWRPNPEKLSPESRVLMEDTQYLFPLNWPCFIWAHLYYFATRPHKYLATLWAMLFESGERPMRMVLHFAQGVYLAWLMERQHVRHIHGAFASNPGNLAFVVSRLTGLPFSFAAHAHDIFVERGLLRQKLAAAQFVVSSTYYNRRYLSEQFPEAAEQKIRVIYHGVRLGDFPPGERPRNAVPIILCVAQFREKKGLPVLIEACRLLRAAGLSFVCSIIGDGPQRPVLEKLIAEHDLAEYVRLEGVIFQDQIREHYRRADVVTLPAIVAADGDRDGIPVTLIEVQAMGCPVVSTLVSGIPEVVEAGRTGLLVPPGDAVALAEALRTVVQNTELRQAMSLAARARMVRLFDLDTNVRRLVDLFAEKLNQSASGQLAGVER
jgi:glycosyltransferase involved in cell wall biosynthesis